MRENVIDVAGCRVVYDPDVCDASIASAFTHSGNVRTASDAGRASVLALEHDGQPLILKRYHRGGLMRHISASTYVYVSLGQTRMLREFRLLQQLQNLNLPVPTPVAIEICRNGLTYTGRILMQQLSARETLADQLPRGIDDSLWQAVGACIARFHDAGLFHADLNANNIMIDGNDVYLIDFDKSALRNRLSSNRREDNLARLRRSLLKAAGLSDSSAFDDNAWRNLRAGYRGG